MPPFLIALLMTITVLRAAETANATGFSAFDHRAQAGERLNVVFFGASLTWGANASDQENTSYRAILRDRLEERYPAAHIRCWDAAIGGTGSTLGAFRLERDVLRHHPDLVFLDFTANDGIYSDEPESLSSYESILHRLASAGIPVVQVAFPFRWDVERAKLPTMKRLAAHHALAEAYGNGWGDAVTRIIDGVEAGTYRIADIWVTDGAHPHDRGYREFAEAAWTGYNAALEAALVPHVPAQPLHPRTYQTLNRFRLANLPSLPAGWQVGRPNLTAIYHDWQMSRWFDDVVVGRNRAIGPDGKALAQPRPVAPLRLLVQAASIQLFGEATTTSGNFRVRIDGVPVTGRYGQIKDSDLIIGNRWKTANGHLVVEIARDLDLAKAHLVEIEPVFADDTDQELRIESLCVAGGAATVTLAP